MKATRAILEAVARLEKEGRVSAEVSVNARALGGPPTLGVVAGENEAAFQARVVTFAQARGWTVAHFRAARVVRNGRETYETPVGADGKGFPDLEMVRERLVKVECKVKKRKRSQDQLRWALAYQRAGVEYYCWYPADHAEIERVLA